MIHKMLAIKDCNYNHQDIYFKSGEIYDVGIDGDYGECIYADFVVYKQLEPYKEIIGEFLGNYREYFIPLSEYRDKQIDEILK